jgi:hypothetical protein
MAIPPPKARFSSFSKIGLLVQIGINRLVEGFYGSIITEILPPYNILLTLSAYVLIRHGY